MKETRIEIGVTVGEKEEAAVEGEGACIWERVKVLKEGNEQL